jgi:hypothetical protein
MINYHLANIFIFCSTNLAYYLHQYPNHYFDYHPNINIHVMILTVFSWFGNIRKPRPPTYLHKSSWKRCFVKRHKKKNLSLAPHHYNLIIISLVTINCCFNIYIICIVWYKIVGKLIIVINSSITGWCLSTQLLAVLSKNATKPIVHNLLVKVYSVLHHLPNME